MPNAHENASKRTKTPGAWRACRQLLRPIYYMYRVGAGARHCTWRPRVTITSLSSCTRQPNICCYSRVVLLMWVGATTGGMEQRPGLTAVTYPATIRYIGYVSRGAFCDNPPPILVPKSCSTVRSPGHQRMNFSTWKFGVVEPARDIPCYIPGTCLHQCFALGQPLQANVTSGIHTVSFHMGQFLQHML